MARRRRPFSVSALAGLLIGALAAALPILALAGLIGRLGGDAGETLRRMAGFLDALPGSLLVAGLLGILAVALAVALSPAMGACRSSRLRIWALALGAGLPQIVLVLGGAFMQPAIGLAVVPTLHILALLPVVSLVAVFVVEAPLMGIARRGLFERISLKARMGIGSRVLTARIVAMTGLAAALCFQAYLINLCLRADPSRDALVAFSALSPHTGTDWALVLTATVAIWLICLMISATIHNLSSGRFVFRGAR